MNIVNVYWLRCVLHFHSTRQRTPAKLTKFWNFTKNQWVCSTFVRSSTNWQSNPTKSMRKCRSFLRIRRNSKSKNLCEMVLPNRRIKLACSRVRYANRSAVNCWLFRSFGNCILISLFCFCFVRAKLFVINTSHHINECASSSKRYYTYAVATDIDEHTHKKKTYQTGLHWYTFGH